LECSIASRGFDWARHDLARVKRKRRHLEAEMIKLKKWNDEEADLSLDMTRKVTVTRSFEH
jgi:hypothetical protein